MTTIHVTASRDYDVLVQPGLLDDAGAQIAQVLGTGRTAAIVSGETVAGLYAGRLAASLTRAGFRAVTFTYPGGEHCKTLATYAALLDFLAAHRLSRSDLIVALGGGVTGDLAGFAAATYQRGIPFVQVPTTLLAAVDSSVGGKTAVNLTSGKNQVGCFYQPSLVLCDPDTLRTLPPEEYRNGCAEVIKYAVLRSEPFFSELRAVPVSAQVEHVIATCVGMKRDLVAADEFDRGSRQLLNLGHSFGHAVEKCSDYAVPHGCGVAIGMAIGNALALLFCLVQGTTHWIKLNPVNYFVSFVPVHVNVPAILLADLAAFAGILLLLLIPTLFIARVDPAKTVKAD